MPKKAWIMFRAMGCHTMWPGVLNSSKCGPLLSTLETRTKWNWHLKCDAMCWGVFNWLVTTWNGSVRDPLWWEPCILCWEFEYVLCYTMCNSCWHMNVVTTTHECCKSSWRCFYKLTVPSCIWCDNNKRIICVCYQSLHSFQSSHFHKTGQLWIWESMTRSCVPVSIWQPHMRSCLPVSIWESMTRSCLPVSIWSIKVFKPIEPPRSTHLYNLYIYIYIYITFI